MPGRKFHFLYGHVVRHFTGHGVAFHSDAAHLYAADLRFLRVFLDLGCAVADQRLLFPRTCTDRIHIDGQGPGCTGIDRSFKTMLLSHAGIDCVHIRPVLVRSYGMTGRAGSCLTAHIHMDVQSPGQIFPIKSPAPHRHFAVPSCDLVQTPPRLRILRDRHIGGRAVADDLAVRQGIPACAAPIVAHRIAGVAFDRMDPSAAHIMHDAHMVIAAVGIPVKIDDIPGFGHIAADPVLPLPPGFKCLRAVETAG